MHYIRLAEGLTNSKLIPVNDDINNHIKNPDKDYYVSLYQYNEDHYKQWKEKKSVAGIKDVTTNQLFFDFDNKDNPDIARGDALTLVGRLIDKGFNVDNIQVAFSGSKGIHVCVDTTTRMTPEEFKNITFALARDLPSFDTVVNDPQRIIRVTGTKHNKTGLYKFPLSPAQLAELPVEEIKRIAANHENIDNDVMEGWQEVAMPDAVLALKKSKESPSSKNVEPIDNDLDISKKPKWLSEAKYALQMGFFHHGERNQAFMILAATYRAQGFPKEIAYRMLKGVAEIQSRRTGEKEKDSGYLWKNVIGTVYGANWTGATYSYQNTPLLQDVTKRLGLKVETKGENSFVALDNVTGIFRRFAEEIDSNTIKLGIPLVDNEVRVTTSMLVGLLAAPSAGKTSISLNILNEASKNDIKAGFFSLDMGAPLVYQRLIQKHKGISGKKIFEMYKNRDKSLNEIENMLTEEYKNVSFCFRSGISTDDIRTFVVQENQSNPDKPMKLLVVDYLECIQGPYSDPTANTALVAQQLKDIANDLEICIILLLQPQKHAGDPSAELLNYRQIKGSSAIEQAASVIFTIWRPGFSPKNPAEDKYLTMAVVKNRMGSLGSFDFQWDGLTGKLTELDEFEREDLNELRKRKAAEKQAQDI